MKTRFLSLNLAGLRDEWLEKREPELVRQLKRLSPDVVCFQEATVSHRDGFYHQARSVAIRVGLRYSVFCPYGNAIEVMCPEQGGIAVVSRWPIADTRHRRLPSGHGQATDARVALLVTLDSPAGLIDVATTHLSWEPREAESRLVQAGMALNELDAETAERPEARAVFIGDLNAEEGEPAIVLLAERLTDAFRSLHPSANGHTWTPENPYTGGWKMPPRRLDYLFCTRSAKVVEAEVVLTSPPVSDHYGLLVELHWPVRREGK